MRQPARAGQGGTMGPPLWWMALLWVLCGAPGCAIPLRLAVAPTVDTRGTLGVEATATLSLGLGVHDAGLTVGAIGGGGLGAGGNPEALGGGELAGYARAAKRFDLRGGLS